MSKSVALLLVLVFLTAPCIILAKPVSGTAIAENSWAEKAPMPSPHSGYQVAVVNGIIYLIGASYRYDPSANLTVVNSNNLAYNPSTDTWTSIAPMLTPRLSFAIAGYNNKIYVFGGLKVTASGGLSRYSCSINEAYDPITNTWTAAASMPTGTSSMQANTVNGKIYVIGGLTGDISADLAVNTTQIYDPISDSWTTGASMPYSVQYYASAAIDDNIYVIGGVDDYLSTKQDPDAKFVQFNQIYDSVANTWSLGSPIPAITLLAGAGATTGMAAQKRIYVMGGMVPGVFPGFGLNQNYVYDPITNSWGSAAPLPVASIEPVVAVVNDRLYVMGGGSDSTAFVNNWLYTPIGYGTADPSYVYEHWPPEISILSPVNQTYNESSVSLIFTVDKAVNWNGYSLDGQQNVTITGNTTIINVTNGLHSITVYAKDTFGNEGASENITFSVKLPEPFPTTLVAIASGASAIAIGGGLLVYFKKRKH
jgi:N-acetylneuraminic acid mutarotase